MNINDEDVSKMARKGLREGFTDLVKLCIERGYDVNVTNEYGKTPLHEAASFGLTKRVELLRKNGANVNVADE